MKTRAEAAFRRSRGYRSARAVRETIEPLERRLLLAAFFVNSAADSNTFDDQLTFREAIMFASGGLTRDLSFGEMDQVSGALFAPDAMNPGGFIMYADAGENVSDLIRFEEITNINPSSQLPNVGRNDRIDGKKPSGAKVVLSGQSAGMATGIVLRSFTSPSANQVRNMEIRNFFYDGIYGEGIQGGLFAGLDIHDNGQDGILLTAFQRNDFNYTRDTRIGGAGSDRNYIYANGRHGISIFAGFSTGRPLLNNQIENNYIGLDNAGVADRGNGQNGVFLSQAHGNIIKDNVISGNNGDGIQINGATAHSNVITNNVIGLDPTRSFAIGNTFSGVALIDAGVYGVESTLGNQVGKPSNGNTIGGNGGAGVYMIGPNANGNTVQGNFIGFGPGMGNATAGVTMYGGANHNTVGGTDPLQGNTIQYSGGPGVDIANGGSNNNLVQNNDIGTDNGTRSRPNNGGIRIYGGAASNTLSQNVISGNSFQGVGIYNPGSTGNMVQANYIGTNSQATAALPNGADGVVIQEGASGNSVSGNVISGNTLSGVFLQNSNTTGNTISGNKIGTKGDGVTGLANQNFGVRINGAVGNTVGLGNIIRFNVLDGVFVEAGTGNAIRGNSITSNGGLGIDLAPDGVTPNDPLDADSGANNLQNTPTVTATITDVGTTIIGGLHSTPNTTFTIDFFSNPSGGDEGESYKVSFDTTTNGNGNANFSHAYALFLPAGINVTATATDPAGNTSEFSAPIKTAVAQSPFTGTLIQAEDFDEGGETLAYRDTTFQNEGGQYRNTAVDIENTSDTGGGHNVGFVRAGEWLEYTVNVASFALYDLGVRLANTATGGRFHVEFNGSNVTGNVDVPSTGGFQTWTTIHVPVTLAAGQQVMRVAFDAEAANTYVGNFNWFQFTLRPLVTALTVNPNPAQINSTLILTAEASDADGTVNKVDFYRESNGTAGLQIGSDTLVGTDPAASGGWLGDHFQRRPPRRQLHPLCGRDRQPGGCRPCIFREPRPAESTAPDHRFGSVPLRGRAAPGPVRLLPGCERESGNTGSDPAEPDQWRYISDRQPDPHL